MNNDLYLIGEVGWEITLDSVINQVRETNQDEPLNVHIHSQGGQVYDGLAIYNYLKSLPQQVNTISSGLVASIASVIFLAGDKETRKINNLDSFLIHLPSGGSWGNAQDLEKTATELRDIEEKLVYSAYTKSITDNTKTYWLGDVMNYLQDETALSGFEDVYGENIKTFKTNNTVETQNLVSKIEANIKEIHFNQNGTVSSQAEFNYLSTDYSIPNLILYFIIRTVAVD